MRTALHYVLVGLGLFGFWVILSGKMDAVHLAMGVLSAAAVTALSGRLLYTEVEPSPSANPTVEPARRWLSFLPWGRQVLYWLWLAYEILKANLALVPYILGPLSRLKPTLVRVKPPLRTEVARYVLANSITLTPGTLTLEHSDGEYLIHALDASAASSVVDGTIPGKVAWAFREEGR